MKENFSETNKSDEILTTSSDLIVLYQKMLLIREAELKVLELRRLDEVAGSLHPCVGQEVVPSAIVNLLASQDRKSVV